MKTISMIILLASSLILSGCAQTTLKAPCPDFGKWCLKTPVNSWKA